MSLIALLSGKSASTPVVPEVPAPAPGQTWPSSFILPARTGQEEKAASTLTAPYNAPSQLVLPGPYTPPSIPSGTHPSVLDFGVQFNGYRWWMAYTPYPNGADALENPCIVASNDRINWVEPRGISNPIHDKPFIGYNSDTELIWDNETHAMWCIFRTVASGQKEIIKAQRSYDGVTWSLPYTLFETGQLTGCLSPTVVKDHNGMWRMYSVGGLGYRTAPNVWGPWSDMIPIKLEWQAGVTPQTPWHVFVRYEWGQYRMLLNANTNWTLHPGVSENGETFRMGPAVLESPSSGWDAGGMYRSTFTPNDNAADYDVWYSTRGSGWQIAYTRIPRKHWWDL